MSTILVVEDDTSATPSLATALSEAGFAVHCEHEVQRAIAATDSFDFDAAIVAGSFPEWSGGQIAQELRARDAELPIFVCTDLNEEAVTNWAAQERMLLLEKPVDEDQLIWLLHAHVGSLS
jgi:DNA-binding response OmpR family regulator